MASRLAPATTALLVTVAFGATSALADGPCGANHDQSHACPVNSPYSASGTITDTAVPDWYVFHASPGTSLHVTITDTNAASLLESDVQVQLVANQEDTSEAFAISWDPGAADNTGPQSFDIPAQGCLPTSGCAALAGGTEYLEVTAFNGSAPAVPAVAYQLDVSGSPNVAWLHQATSQPSTTTAPTPAPHGCGPRGGGVGKRLIGALKCTWLDTKYEAECGFAVVNPLKALKALKTAKGLYDLTKIKKVSKAAVPLARLYNDLMKMRFSRRAPKGFRTGAQVWHRITQAKNAWDIVKVLPKLTKAMSRKDYLHIASDMARIAGLSACVDGLELAVAS